MCSDHYSDGKCSDCDDKLLEAFLALCNAVRFGLQLDISTTTIVDTLCDERSRRLFIFGDEQRSRAVFVIPDTRKVACYHHVELVTDLDSYEELLAVHGFQRSDIV